MPDGSGGAAMVARRDGKAAGVSYRTIFRLENEQRDIQTEKAAAIRRAFEVVGVTFAEPGGVFPPT